MKKLFIILLIIVLNFSLFANNNVEMGKNYYTKIVAKYLEDLKGNKAEFTKKLQSFFNDSSKQLGFGFSYHAAAPAKNFNIKSAPNFDIGLELSILKVDTSHEFWQYIIKDSEIPPALIFPRIHFNMSLPHKFEIGTSFSMVPNSNIWLIGGEIKYLIIGDDDSFFHLSARGGFSSLIGMENIKISSLEANLGASFNLTAITPYLGGGFVSIISDATIPKVHNNFSNEVADYLGVSGASRNEVIKEIDKLFPKGEKFFNIEKYSHTVPKIYAGVKFSLLLVNFVTEIALSYDIANKEYINTFFTLRANFHF